MDQMKREADHVVAQEKSRRNLKLKRQKLVEATTTRQKVHKEWTEHGGNWLNFPSLTFKWHHYCQPNPGFEYFRLYYIGSVGRCTRISERRNVARGTARQSGVNFIGGEEIGNGSSKLRWQYVSSGSASKVRPAPYLRIFRLRSRRRFPGR